MYNNYMNNPYMTGMPQQNNLGMQFQPQAQKQEIIRVHGREGADAYPLGPNSSVLLMDETSNVVWAKVTDGAGFATLSDYTITPREHNENKSMNSYVNNQEGSDFVSKEDFESLKNDVNRLNGEVKNLVEELK